MENQEHTNSGENPNSHCQSCSTRFNLELLRMENQENIVSWANPNSHCQSCSILFNLVLTNIFVRLPAKSLLRIKCVCKSWYNIIDDYRFTKLHFERSNRLYLIISDPVLHLTDVDTLHNPIILPYPFHDVGDDFIRSAFYQYTRVVGNSRGLFCFYMIKSPYTVILYNPTTRTHKILPSPPTIDDEKDVYMGFGYDPVSDDYQFVKVFPSAIHKNSVLIYSLKSDSWRVGIHDPPELFVRDEQECIDLNGTLHWSTIGNSQMSTPIILTFNLSNQTFDKISFPSTFRDPRIISPVNYHLGVLDDCLSLVRNFNYNSTKQYLDVHIKKGRFWITLCEKPILDCVRYSNLKCVYYFKKMDKLLVTNNWFDMGYLDIKSLEITDLMLPQLIRIRDAYVCSENVLMLKDDDRALQENPEVLQRKIKDRQTLLETTLRELRALGTSRFNFSAS